ncbi:carbohydrate kinase family protein [Actinoplanes derwentensis]|uniref:Sugar or nucleoside kinase, ribokinase family n=1 Tax=Actinoplanes derwentensis TaxID=113562 RepID=A0A1H1SN17_9ACTN|nr:carbohydrate kinase family protein [Actinoplanes derwentensis]GID83255.1 carbohydrate kinase [Actinoplanes derwentensis]SDS49394.1 Sugar or nucleoside kinase, ribokinase family [Actinoplanes derwentensis]
METPETDVFLSGLLFVDVVFGGLPQAPVLGTETWATSFDTGPGGIANMAVALRRLGLRTSLAAAFGDDFYGDYCWRTLGDREDIDLSRSRRFPGWPMPVTAALAYGGDRALVTHEKPAPITLNELIGEPPTCRAAMVHLGQDPPQWLTTVSAAGGLVFADVGWDPDGRWPEELLDQLSACHAFMPNEHEAMAYTRTSTPQAALARIADLVPLAVVTRGDRGALAIDASTGETAEVAGLPVTAVDPTGAGDVFCAGMIAATLAGLSLADRLRFANLCAALSVQGLGGANSAPDQPRLRQWRETAPPSLRHEYGFLDSPSVRKEST